MRGWAVILAGMWIAPLPAEDTEFFEKKIRPILIANCYECHSKEAKKLKAGLRVDGRMHLLNGGDNGPAIIAGDAVKSRLIQAVKYSDVELQMPPKGKLPANVIADLETWVNNGAVWPGGEDKADAERRSFELLQRKAEHWAWQPVKAQSPPSLQNESWPRDPLDRFILAKLEAKNLSPAKEAEKGVWLRRVTFALTGLPPSPEELTAFEKDESPAAFATVVDRLLASPAYGERWARHWLDLVRYAESRGHEHDPDIPNAWQYRDYVVRAFNADVQYNQFAMEHLAGDVLPKPRLSGIANESMIGSGFWLLGEEAHSPVDIRQDQADRFDNRIDVFGKTFLGLTIACARCHDHKFDAISTKDYYALFGLLQGSGYHQMRCDGQRENRRIAEELAKFREGILGEVMSEVKAKAVKSHPVYDAWRSQTKTVIDYSRPQPGDWQPDDASFGLGPRNAGSIRIVDGHAVLDERTAASFDRFWANLATSEHTSNDTGSLGQRPRAGFTIRTPSFTQEKNGVFALVRGGGLAYAAVCGHTMINGPLHGGLSVKIADGPGWRWLPIPLTLYQGLRLHLEFTADPKTDFAVALVVQADHSPPAIPPPEKQFEAIPADISAEIVKKLEMKEKELAARAVWTSRVAPTLWDGSPISERVFIRGNPRTLGEIVPHRGLEALDGPQPLQHASGSGRYEWACRVTDAKTNPFFARVIVNRFWHHLFGRGIVASTDNFGVLGESPTHAELLDYLATEFVAGGYKIKPFLKRLVLTQAYRMSSEATDNPLDPNNQLLHHFRIQRLEGEAIRDSMLAVSGRLDRTVGGPPVPMHMTAFMEGRGRPAESGPVDGRGRRSIYLAVRRNFLSPFLLAFDMPIPFSTIGTRQVSNVPAQALILMNDPFVHEQAKLWGKSMAAKPGKVESRIAEMYQQAFARKPNDDEAKACREFLGENPDTAAWGRFAHSLFNVKEFRYVP